MFTCTKCNLFLQEVQRASKKAYCKPCAAKRARDYRKANPGLDNKYKQKYIKNNKDKFRASRRAYMAKKSKDIIFRLRKNLRTRTWLALKGKKQKSIISMLGCDVVFYQEYIQNKFQIGMTWDNYGDWQIDHIKPLASAKSTSEVEGLCHYTNTQPLWKIDNLRKGAK